MPDATPNDSPAWGKEYPIKQSEEHATSRRTFAKVLGIGILATTGGILVKNKLFATASGFEPKAIAAVDDLAVGENLLFKYPTEGDSCILIRLTSEKYVAYSQNCTHLMCPVHYDQGNNQLVCPCHKGFFDATDGSVISGPPPRALPQYEVTVKDGEIWVQ